MRDIARIAEKIVLTAEEDSQYKNITRTKFLPSGQNFLQALRELTIDTIPEVSQYLVDMSAHIGTTTVIGYMDQLLDRKSVV